jgi:deoxycytidine triphosphate deaminase
MKHIAGPNSRSTLTNIFEGDVQPNAVDLRLGKVLLIRPSTFTITEEDKTHRGSVELKLNTDGYYVLQEGHYEVVMENVIEVGDGEAGWVITRSTLNRNGVFLTSGLYDSGYHGVMAACMHVSCGPMRIKPGTRIGQYISFDSEALSKYEGSYGLRSEHDQKYAQPETVQPTIEDILEPLHTQIIEVLDELKTDEPVKRGRGRPRKVAN